MEILNFFAQDAQGNIMPSAECYLYAPGTTNLVSGLVDINGMPISNPFQASNIGKVQFGAPNGVYDLRIKKGVRDTTIRIQCADIVQAMDVMDSILGSHAENPTTRNNGQPLEPGDETWNSTDKQPYWWNGADWVALNSSAQQLEASLATQDVPGKGAGMVNFVLDALGSVPVSLSEQALLTITPKNFGAIADNTLHTAQEWIDNGRFADLAALRVEYPFVTDLSEQIDYIASQAMVNFLAIHGSTFSPWFVGQMVWNRELIIRSSMHIRTEGAGDVTRDWLQRPAVPNEGTTIRMVGDGSICSSVKTRRTHRSAITDPQDEPFSAAINIQSKNVKIDPLTIICDYDPVLLKSDPTITYPAVAATLDANGEPIAPGYYGAPEVKVPTYWGANWGCGVFVGSRVCVDITGVQVVGGFRDSSVYVSGADQSNIPRLKDWRGESYPEIEFSGADQFTADKVKAWGSPYSIKVLGAAPARGFRGYGKDHSTRLALTFSSQPNTGDLLRLGGVSIYTTFQFVAQVGNLWPAASAGNIRIKIRDNLAETLYEAEKVILAASYALPSSDNALFYASCGCTSDNVLMIYARSPGNANFASQFRASTTNASARITIPNSGAPQTGLGDAAPYFWATSDTPVEELALYGYGNGSVADTRTSVGMSDLSIIDAQLRGIRRGARQVGQIRLDRDRTRDHRGANVWIDGIAGNGAGRIQKLYLGSARYGFSGMACGLKLGFCNLLFIESIVSDENSSVPRPLSAAVNNYGWYMEHRIAGVETARFYGCPGETSPSPLLSPAKEYTLFDSFGRKIIVEEKGSWTPVLEGGTVAGTNGYTYQLGSWSLIGNSVRCPFRLQLSGKDAAMSGPIRIGGLPFPINNGVTSLISAINFSYATGITVAAGHTALGGQTASGDSFVTLISSNFATTSALTETAIGDTTHIRGVIEYVVR